MAAPLSLELPDEVLEMIAARAAAIIAERTAPPADDGFLDAEGAAAFLACNIGRIYALTHAGRLPHRKDGRRLLFDRAELRAYVEAGGARRP